MRYSLRTRLPFLVLATFAAFWVVLLWEFPKARNEAFLEAFRWVCENIYLSPE